MSTTIFSSMNSGLRPSIVDFRKWSFVADGDNIPRYYDENQGYNWKATTPTTAITASTSSGNMNGVYSYFYTEFNINTGEGSEYYGHETPPSPIYTTGTLSSNQVVLTLPAAALNTGFTHLKIYRKDPGSTVFYYIGKVTIGTTSFTDNAILIQVNFPFGKVTTDSAGAVSQDLTWFTQVRNPKFILPLKNRIIGLGTRPHKIGTVAVTSGYSTVTGTGTYWTKAHEGQTFYCNGESRGYLISVVNSATSITLGETYAGTTKSGVSHEISSDDALVTYTALDPLTGKPQFWAFPSDHYRYVNRKDPSPIMGGGVIQDQPIIFKQESHVLLTENGDAFSESEAPPKIGTCSGYSIVPDSESGSLYFLSNTGAVYKTNGLSPTDLGIDLTQTTDGINLTNGERCQSVWYDAKKWFMMIYPSRDYTGAGCDRILVYDAKINEWVIWKIYANCIHMLEVSEGTQTVKKPHIGTIGGFIYKLCTGYNFGASSGTLKGTITSLGTTTLTDSGAVFDTTEDGLEDVRVSRYDVYGDFIEDRRIVSNTGTILTVESAWTAAFTPGETYEIGSIPWKWRSKVFDFDSDNIKVWRKTLINFVKTSSSRTVRLNFYFSDSTEMPTTRDHYIDFDTSQTCNVPESNCDNKSRYGQFEITGHGVNDPVTLNNVSMGVL